MNTTPQRLFGTDGIRTRTGLYPLTAEALPHLGSAIARWAMEKYGSQAHFLLGADTRYSGSWIKTYLASGLLNHPVTITDAHILPTPALFHLVKDNPTYTCGIMISASHNPAEDNGIKLIDACTGKLTREDEQRICFFMAENAGQASRTIDDHAEERLITSKQPLQGYIQKLAGLFPPLFLKGQTVVLDCAHGAMYRCAPEVFKVFGAEVVKLNNEPDGYNINKDCGALHPDGLRLAVLKHRALLGCAFDGDGDRLIVVNRQGVVKDGDDILAILLSHPHYKDQTGFVTTVLANQGFEVYLKALGKECIRTQVGDKYVVEGLTQRSLLLGGEPSGHIILRDIVPTGDGLLVALKLLETILITGNLDLTSFTKFPQIQINLPVKLQKNLNEPPLSDVIAASKQRLHDGRLLVRYSGTEPLVRIMVEDADHELIQSVAHSLARHLESMLS